MKRKGNGGCIVSYPPRDDARRDVFEYIELFYNPKRKHTNNGMLSPVNFEISQQKLNKAGVYETRGTSDLLTASDSRAALPEISAHLSVAPPAPIGVSNQRAPVPAG